MATKKSCPPRQYANVTQNVRNCFEQHARKKSEIRWDGDNETGTVTYKKGAIVVVTQYRYDPATQVLTLEVTQKPAVGRCDRIYKRMLDGLKDCGYQP
jgi:Ca2+-dependent lipid-binding protein